MGELQQRIPALERSSRATFWCCVVGRLRILKTLVFHGVCQGVGGYVESLCDFAKRRKSGRKGIVVF